MGANRGSGRIVNYFTIENASPQFTASKGFGQGRKKLTEKRSVGGAWRSDVTPYLQQFPKNQPLKHRILKIFVDPCQLMLLLSQLHVQPVLGNTFQP